MRLFRKKRLQNDINDFFKYDNWWQYVINKMTGNNERFISGEGTDLFNALYGTSYACLLKRSQSVAKTQWKLYTTEKTSSRSKVITSRQKDYLFSLQSISHITKSAIDIREITSSPILDILRQVSDLENEYTLKQGTIMFQDIEGDCFWYCPKGELTDSPLEITFIPPQYMTPVMVINDNKPTSTISHYIYKCGQEEIRYEKDEIVHYKYFNPTNQLKGCSPTKAACESISLDKDMVTFLFDTLSNRLRQEMLLTSEGQLQQTSIESIQKQMQEYRKSKKEKIPVLPGNLKAVPLSGSVRDLPFTSNRKFEREQICNVYGVPITMFTEGSSRAEREVAKAELAEDTTFPLCEQLQQQMNQVFIPMFGDDSVFISFDDPVPRNRELDLQERVGYVQAGIWSINEVRAEQKRDAIENGDIHYIQANQVPLGSDMESEGKAFAKAIIEELNDSDSY